MKRGLLLGGAVLALSSSLALAAPDSLLPDIYSNPAPTPTPTQTVAPAPAPTIVPPDPTVNVQSGVRLLPGIQAGGVQLAPVDLPEDFPTIEELEEMQSELQVALRRKDALQQQLAGEQPLLDSSGGAQSELDERITGHDLERITNNYPHCRWNWYKTKACFYPAIDNPYAIEKDSRNRPSPTPPRVPM